MRSQTGLTCAVGIGETKLQAKTATGFAKPGGIATLTQRTWLETMGDRPVTALWGIGSRMAGHLAGLDPYRARASQRRTITNWPAASAPGSGPPSRSSAWRGPEPRARPPHVPRLAQPEETFEHDLSTADEIRAQVIRLAEEVTALSSPRAGG